jgi:hypothetical protein
MNGREPTNRIMKPKRGERFVRRNFKVRFFVDLLHFADGLCTHKIGFVRYVCLSPTRGSKADIPGCRRSTNNDRSASRRIAAKRSLFNHLVGAGEQKQHAYRFLGRFVRVFRAGCFARAFGAARFASGSSGGLPLRLFSCSIISHLGSGSTSKP